MAGTIYRGGCACGAIRYEISSRPVFENHCQCIDCRKVSGTGHGSYLTFAGRDAVKVSGEAAFWDVVADSGNSKTHAFCPKCGSPVYLTFAAMPDLFTIHAGSLDDADQFNPQVLTYAVRGPVWDVIDPAIKSFDRMPAE
jgi:hypothetical protein